MCKTPDRQPMIDELRRGIKRLHDPIELMLVCAGWYAAYPLNFSLHRRHDGRVLRGGRPRDDPSLGVEATAGAGQGVSLPQALPWKPKFVRNGKQP